MSNIAEQIKILIDVQGVEMEILQTARQIQAMNNETASLDREAAERETLVANEKNTRDNLNRSYRELESESKINREMIVKSNEKLRAVKTNKEYQSILKEIEDIRKKNSSVEDQMLQQLESIESAENAAKEKETELQNFMQVCQEKRDVLATRAKQERQAIDTLNEKKMRISAKADPKMISILEDVKTKIRGLPVVPVQEAICMGCNMNIPAQLFNELQRFDELRFCPHCHRIVYWKDKDTE